MAKSIWNDPLSQSFMVAYPGGVFATSLDLYFLTKDANIPVTVQLREMFNGYPTQKILPFSEVTLEPASVNVVDLQTQDPDPTLATTFTFGSPVYLQDGIEYALVVTANSDKYQLWYAGLGEDEYGTGIRISATPYAGVLFKSNNASTWVPDPNKDLKFKLNRAIFNTAVTGSLVLDNEVTPNRVLTKNPIVTTNGSSIVKIVHKNHGFFNPNNGVSSYVTLSGLTPATSYNGILGSTLNTTHEILSVEPDSYTIDVTTLANGTGIIGGSDVVASTQMTYNTFQTSIAHMTFPGTSAAWGYKGAVGVSISDSTTTPYVVDAGFSPLIVDKNINVKSPRVVASSDNVAGASFTARCLFDSAASNLSPVFDLERAQLITVANRIDNPAATAISGFNAIEDYYDETDFEKGSALAKYVSKTVQLNQSSSTLDIFLDINRPSGSFVDVYYRVGIENNALEVTNWTLASPVDPIPVTDNPDTYSEIEYQVSPGIDYNLFQVKIVFRTTNTSNVPVCKAFRAIALA